MNFIARKKQKPFWANQFWDWMDVEFLNDHFNLDYATADWIFNNHTRWEDYKQDFKDIFDMNIKDYISDCYDESEIDDYD